MNLIQLHTAGATVRHSSPFSDIAVPMSREPLSAEIRDEWVRPLYFGMRQPHVRSFLASHISLVSDDLVSQLLTHFDWRTRVSAAYLAAVTGRANFRNWIGKLLLRSDVCYAGTAYCVALAEFDDDESVDVLRQYLNYYLERKELWFDQGDAMAALVYLDTVRHTDVASAYKDRWSLFVSDKPNWNLEKKIIDFAENMTLLQALKQKGIG